MATVLGMILTSKLAPSIPTTPMGTPQPTARPRLVPKSTAAMRDGLSKSGPGGAKSGGSGPDPNQVWNKNRRMYFAAIGAIVLELTCGF